MPSLSPRFALLGLILTVQALAACGDDGDPSQGGGGGGGGVQTTTTDASATASTGTSSHSTSSGSTSSGSSSSTRGPMCTPGEEVPCYSGPPETEGVGACIAGTQFCNQEGTGFGACEDETLPGVETCESIDDEDCDGLANEDGAGCACVPGASASCYTGPAGTEGVGICAAGTQTCNADGLGYGSCEGETIPALDDCTTVADEDCDGVPSSCPGDELWSKRFGDANFQFGYAVATDAADNILLTGAFGETVDFGGGTLTAAGDYDVFVAKFGPAGSHEWSRRFGDGSGQHGYAVSADATGNVLVTGSFAGTVDFGGGVLTSGGGDDIFVAKLDPAGNHLWSKRFGDVNHQYGYGVTADAAGNVLVTGSFAGTVNFGGSALTTNATTNDIFIAKFDPSGNHLWSKRFGTANEQNAYAVTTDASGNVLIGGRFANMVDFGGNVLVSAGSVDMFVAKFDASGAHVWSKGFGGAGDQTGRSVDTDAAGNVVVTGAFAQTIDFGGGALSSAGASDACVAKLDSAGNHVWSKRFGDVTDQYANGVAVDAVGNVVVIGRFAGTVDFGGGGLSSGGGNDIYVTKFTPSGTHLWSERFGGAGDQSGLSLATDAASNLVVTGYFAQTVDFGGGTLTSAGSDDIFLAKLAP